MTVPEIFYDRLTQKNVDVVASQYTILGQWLLSLDISDDSFLNSVPVSAGNFLVPEASGKWSFLYEGCKKYNGSFAKSQMLDELEIESIKTLAAHLDLLVEEGASWLTWLDVIPLVPGMSDSVEFLPFEQRIKDSIGHLETVCKKPRAHLHIEVERVHVSKARRVSSSAPAYLSAHTEDWDRPLLKGVLPKRVLAEVRHDQVDIYENRVVARLVDNLLFYLSQRIQKVQKLLKVFADKENYSNAAGGTYLRMKRVLQLWGNSIDANEGRRKAERTLNELEWLKYKLMGLMNSTLYREVPRRSYVPTTLRMTNILASDQHYRHVAELWHEWGKSSSAKIKSPKELLNAFQELCGGVDKFAVLLVIRALDELGYEPSELGIEYSLKPGCILPIRGKGMTFELCWELDGTITIKLPHSSFRVISFANDFASNSSEQQVQNLIEKINNGTEENAGHILLLYASSDDRESSTLSLNMKRALHTIGNDPRSGLSSGVGLLPVSPWEIGSVERVARFLRWNLDSERFQNYPIDIPLQTLAGVDFNAGVRDRWLQVANGKVTILRPPKDFEWDLLGLEGQLSENQNKLCEIESEHERLSLALRNAVRDRKGGALNQQKKAANQLKLELSEKNSAFVEMFSALKHGCVQTKSLLCCPACGTKVDAKQDFEIRGMGSFECVCTSCHTSWGTRICEKEHKFSVMRPSKWFETGFLDPGWEDKIYGCDLLAVPAKTNNGEWGFVCPFCGVVTT